MGSLKFKTTLLLAGKTATGFVVPDDIVEKLGAGKKPPVRVTIKGYTYRNTIAVMGGKFMIGVSADHRAKAGVNAGDTVGIGLELDTEPREVTVPADLQKALTKNPGAKKFFDSLSYSHRRRHVLVIEEAKTEETRQRRIEKAIEMLKEGKK
jgi:hypothetical protein